MKKENNIYKRAFVLLSGGVDSSTCVAIAKKHMDSVGGQVVAYTMDYGQRHVKEAEAAKGICAHYDVEHEVIDVRGFVGKTMLTDDSIEVPNISYAEIKGVSPTYVPFRNGFMLSRLTAKAQEYVDVINKAHPDVQIEDLVTLYCGVHAEDAENWAYPDCTPEFIGAMANAIYIGTYRAVRLQAPLNYMTKDEIILKGSKLGVPYEITWSCYKGEEIHCGVCPTCRARKEAFNIANVKDKTKYKQ